MLGCGLVGGSVAKELASAKEDLAARSGAHLELARVAVRNLAPRDGVSDSILTTDAKSVVTDPEIELVIEVMGGIEPARELILLAIQNGKSVVTANKALLAAHGADLYAAAEKAGVDLYYEAAVAGAIPIIRPLRESLVGDRINRVMGIVNGTTNFILTKMDEESLPFDVVLKEAQALGYAEADPTADVEGHDAAAKAAILAGLAFHTRVTINDVAAEGITKVTAQDVATAKSMGKVIKLIAEAKRTGEGISVRVAPMMLDRSHPLAAVREAFNAVFVESEGAGQLMFYGRGAGGAPTASAVLGDVVAVARHIVAGSKGPAESDYADLGIAPKGAAMTKYAIRLSVNDRPGVLATVANTFASEGVSIQTVLQKGRGDDAELTVVTHRGTEAALSATVEKLSKLDAVREVESVIRVEGSAS